LAGESVLDASDGGDIGVGRGVVEAGVKGDGDI
jgi:hypothetical protein